MLPSMPTARAEPPDPPRGAAAGKARRVDADVWVLLALSLAVLWVYLPPRMLTGGVLFGADSFTLHVRRLEFARDHLFGPSPGLPAWYPREFLGTPFWSNLQNFPLIPTRLPLLLVDPWAAHGIGVNLAAVLTAAFTYVLCRRLGVGRLGSAVAAWTFPCCGFFASRVMAGHLPLLEAYPALPLLLWLVERYRAADSPRSVRVDLLALALATGFVMVAGHPQLPIYAVGAALLYLPVRLPWRKSLTAAASMAAGVGCMSFVLLPMAKLVGRSTRILALAAPRNDVYFPLWRLKAFLRPWSDVPVERYIFWDTTCYVGWLPLAAAAVLLVRSLVTRRPPKGPWLFLTALGVLALLLAFPRPWAGAGGGWTILRSPARQVYLTVFTLSLAAGAATDWLLRAPRARGRLVLVAITIALVAAHAFDLRTNVAHFIEAVDRPADPGVPPALAEAVGDGRVAMDTDLIDPNNRRLDDVGVFDSVLLARPYRALLALSDQRPETNTQLISGPDLAPRALAWSGVRMVVTTRKDLALPSVEKGGNLSVYFVPNPLPRAGFVPRSGALFLDDAALQRELRSGAMPRPDRLYLPPAAAGGTPTEPATGPATAPAATVTYRRPNPDRIEVDVTAPVDGYVRVLETPDAGWTATLDGRQAELLVADGFVSAVRVPAGSHSIHMTYATPGVALGAALSAVAAVVLAAVVVGAPRLAASPAGA
jgi:hypothetical protein